MPISPVPLFHIIRKVTWYENAAGVRWTTRPYSDLIRWTILTGMAYLPATTPPIGRDSDGLPVSFQVVGPYGGDYTTIRLAKFIAEHNSGYSKPPMS